MKTYKDTISGETLYVVKNYDSEFYYKDKAKQIRHRVDGPAVEWSHGTKYWIRNNEYHRLDGPANDFPFSEQLFFVGNVYITGIDENGEYEGPNWLQGELDNIKHG